VECDVTVGVLFLEFSEVSIERTARRELSIREIRDQNPMRLAHHRTLVKRNVSRTCIRVETDGG
jgi:hypothetical protein